MIWDIKRFNTEAKPIWVAWISAIESVRTKEGQHAYPCSSTSRNLTQSS